MYIPILPSQIALSQFDDWLVDHSKDAPVTQTWHLELLDHAETARNLGESCVTYELPGHLTKSRHTELTTFEFDQFDWEQA